MDEDYGMRNNLHSHHAERLDADCLLTLKQVINIVNFSHDWIYRQIAKGEFPRQVKYGTASRWRRSEILAWIDGVWTPSPPIPTINLPMQYK